MLGIGLRREHFAQILQEQPDVDWFELLSENYLHRNSPNLRTVLKIRESYPMSMHGVGLSLGSADGVAIDHLRSLQTLMHQIDPLLISEHLSWSNIGGVYLPDLLPVPYNEQSFTVFSKNINQSQDFLQRELLIENPSTYLEYKSSCQEEVDFLVALCKSTGAKILLDVNNIFVSCSNHNWDSNKYIQSIPPTLVKEIHISGHTIKKISEDKILRIDTHDNYVCDEVWELYRLAIARFGAVPTLLEWDEHIPELNVLISEVNKANAYVDA